MQVKKWRYQDWLAFSFGFGVLLGTAAVRFFGWPVVLEQVRQPEQAAFPDRWEALRLFCVVFRCRFLQLTAGWLMGMTVCSVPLFCMTAAYGGLSAAVTLSLLTARKGMLGLPAFLIGLFPQWIIYGAVWWILASWASGTQKKVRLGAFLLLILFTACGAGAEILVNPIFSAYFF